MHNVPRIYYVSTRFGFLSDPEVGNCKPDVRVAYPFSSFSSADDVARTFARKGVFRYWAVVTPCLAELPEVTG